MPTAGCYTPVDHVDNRELALQYNNYKKLAGNCTKAIIARLKGGIRGILGSPPGSATGFSCLYMY